MRNEYWFTTTKKGQKMAWYYSTLAGRAIRVSLSEAELMILSGQATEVTKPIWVGK